MNKANKTGGSAFPGNQSSGMSLRDYFAGQSLQGLLAGDCDYYSSNYVPLARESYSIADEMIKAREEGND